MPAGIVLAGGRSSRMGTPKAWLDWHGSTLLRRVCGLVARGAEGVILGCTEIELLIGPEDVDVPVFPTTALHVEAAVAAALG